MTSIEKTLMNKTVLCFCLIVILGVILRFYKLGDLPIGLHRDEAFLGYNAYSILKTGKDMSENFLPLHLKSFLYSPALYSYISIPFIAIFDLSAFSVRFASALFGSLTILITYFLTRELFHINSKSDPPAGGQNSNNQNSKLTLEIRNLKLEIPIIASTMLAISPWHINLSRAATENTIVVFFISLGLLFYLLWLKRFDWLLLFLSFASFGLTLLIYQAPRAFLPMFIPLMVILLSKKIVLNDKRILSALLLFLLVIVVPLFFILSSKELSLRIRTVNVFATSETQLILDQHIREDGVTNTENIVTRVFHNKLVGYSATVLKNYFSHFSYNFFFTDQGLPDRYRIPQSGLMYLFELPLLFLGIWYLLQINKRVTLFLIGWILLVPIGSALTFDDVPNLQRTLIVFPAVSIISASGLFYTIFLAQRKELVGTLVVAFIFLVIAFGISFYLHQYYVHASVYSPWYRQDGYKRLVNIVNALLPQYKKVVVTDRESAPTIFFLFYGKYDPLRFQHEKESNMRDFDRINFGRYEFSQEECPLKLIKKDGRSVATGEKGVLYVNSGLCTLYSDFYPLSTIQRADGSLVFRIFGL